MIEAMAFRSVTPAHGSGCSTILPARVDAVRPIRDHIRRRVEAALAELLPG